MTEVVRRLGSAVASGRRRRRLTQAELAARIGISRASLSRIETGRGDGVRIGTWVELATELGLTARFELARDWREAPVDAGHLALQELLLRLGRAAGYARTFELPIGRSAPVGWIDVLLRDDVRRRLIVAEAWNIIGDVGASARSFDRKLAAARDLAVAIGGETPYSVHGVWVVGATRRNRALVARYPEAFATRFPGSSRSWSETFMRGARPPNGPGLVWADVRATRVFAWRRSPAPAMAPAAMAPAAIAPAPAMAPAAMAPAAIAPPGQFPPRDHQVGILASWGRQALRRGVGWCRPECPERGLDRVDRP